MLKVTRFIAFLPAALVASVLLGALGHWIGGIGFGLFGGGELLAWLLSGLGSAFGFVFVGLKVAPDTSPTVKWILAILLAALGMVACLGFLFSGETPFGSVACVVMLLAAIGVMRTPVDRLNF